MRLMPVSEGLVLAGFSCKTNQSVHMEMHPGGLLQTRAIVFCVGPVRTSKAILAWIMEQGYATYNKHSLPSQLDKLPKKRGLHKLVKGGELTSTIYAAQLGW